MWRVFLNRKDNHDLNKWGVLLCRLTNTTHLVRRSDILHPYSLMFEPNNSGAQTQTNMGATHLCVAPFFVAFLSRPRINDKSAPTFSLIKLITCTMRALIAHTLLESICTNSSFPLISFTVSHSTHIDLP